jgi:hypothetical protein
MAQPAAPQALVTVVILALLAWRMYARIKRNIGRQRLSARRPWMTVIIFPVLLALLALGARAQPQVLAALAGGLALGIALGIFGFRLTRFEVTPEGRFYTPSAHLGIALSTLLVCRIVYRFVVYGLPGAHLDQPNPPTPLNSLTLFLIGLLGGYYVTYAIGLLRWSRATSQTAAQLSTPSSDQRS